MDLKEMFKSGVSLARLAEGEHKFSLEGASFHEHDTDPSKNYVKLSLKLDDRTISDNRFEKGFNVFLSQIKKQLGWEDVTISVPDLLQELQDRTEPLKLWISYVPNKQGTGFYRNINFLEPLKIETVDPSQLSDEELPV